jgi:hypothetical protein
MSTHWENFMITAAEAAAALTGLVMVAVSVNLARILSFKHLPARAGAVIGGLILVVVVGLAGLIPQDPAALGAEVVFFALISWLLHLHSARRMFAARREHDRPWHEVLRAIASGQLQTVPVVVGGLLLAESNAGGLYWIAAGIIAIFVSSTFNAWVFLVEILR